MRVKISARLPRRLGASILPVSGALFSRLSGYIVLILVARTLIPEEFGIFTMLVVIAALVNATVSGGGDMWLNRFINTRKAHRGRMPKAWLIYLALCGALAVFLITTAFLLSYTIPVLMPFAPTICAAVGMGVIGGLAEAMLALLRTRGKLIAFFVLRDLVAPASILMLILWWQPDAALSVFAIGIGVWGLTALALTVFFITGWRQHFPHPFLHARIWRLAFRHTAGLLSSNLSSRLAVSIDALVLGMFLALPDYGEYRVAAQVAIGFIVVQHFFFLTLPWQLKQSPSEDRFSANFSLVAESQRTLILVSAIGLMVILAGADPLLSLFGERFRGASTILQILLLIRWGNLLWGPQHEVLISNGRVVEDIIANLVAIAAWGVAFLGVLPFLAPQEAAIVGVAAASLGGEGVRFLLLRRSGLLCPRLLGSYPDAARRGEAPLPSVLVVVPTLGIGGTEHHLAQLLPRIDRTRFRVRVFTLFGEQNAVMPRLKQGGIEVITPPAIGSGSRPLSRIARYLAIIAAAFRLCRFLVKTRPAIIHFFLPMAYLVGGFCSVLSPASVRVMSRRSLNRYQEKRPWIGSIERWLHRWMAAVIGNSQAVVEELRAEGVPKARLGLIHNGIDLTPFENPPGKTEARAALDLGESALVMILVANLIPYKGHADLLKALARIAPDLPPEWVLLCVGRDDGIGSQLRQQAEGLGLEGHIRWLGERDDVPHLLYAADIGLLCSHEEGFSNAILEGMAAGLPMVVTEVGGNTESVVEGETGRVAPARDPQALGRAILDLAASPTIRATMGEAGRRRVEEEFTISACVARYEALYAALIENAALPVTKALQAETPAGLAPPVTR
jgi:glycosyltransferase involved in cell wall biosynthesis/O-antigen/teichoic acid export membrane protein